MASTMSEYRKKIGALKKNLGNVCVECNSENGLQFDHIDPSIKEFAIASNWGLSWKRLLPELAKCQLLCKPCHLTKSREEGSLGGIPWNKVENPIHGTWVMYSRKRCRCDLCTKWRRDYRTGLVDTRGNSCI